MSNPHVLVIPGWYPTEFNTLEGCFFREQAIALSNHGFKTGVVAPQVIYLGSLRSRKNYKTGFNKYLDNGVMTYQRQHWNLFPKLHSWREARNLSIGMNLFERYADENGLPDIIHAHVALYGGHVASQISKKFNIPYVVTEHSSNYAKKLYLPRQLELACKVFLSSSANIAVSPHLGSLLGDLFPEVTSPWFYIPNIVSNKFFLDPAKRKIEKISAGDSKFTFLNVASLSEKKGHEYLLRAFASAFSDDRNVKLIIGGDGPLKRDLFELADSLGIQGQVDFIGFLQRDQVAKEMQECDAFVLSSPYETFGVVLVEAFANGKPVVATRCGGPEGIVNESNGILVPPKDIDALAKAMKEVRIRILEYDPQRISIECREKYGEGSIVKALGKVYETVLGKDKIAEKNT